ncbi:hypothetical protein N0V95_006348 [Ascochyta clinopodiicola]|nr:hypothetical protein N0V95_006348 [Ascochyta clinopodiicola]
MQGSAHYVSSVRPRRVAMYQLSGAGIDESDEDDDEESSPAMTAAEEKQALEEAIERIQKADEYAQEDIEQARKKVERLCEQQAVKVLQEQQRSHEEEHRQRSTVLQPRLSGYTEEQMEEARDKVRDDAQRRLEQVCASHSVELDELDDTHDKQLEQLNLNIANLRNELNRVKEEHKTELGHVMSELSRLKEQTRVGLVAYGELEKQVEAKGRDLAETVQAETKSAEKLRAKEADYDGLAGRLRVTETEYNKLAKSLQTQKRELAELAERLQTTEREHDEVFERLQFNEIEHDEVSKRLWSKEFEHDELAETLQDQVTSMQKKLKAAEDLYRDTLGELIRERHNHEALRNARALINEKVDAWTGVVPHEELSKVEEQTSESATLGIAPVEVSEAGGLREEDERSDFEVNEADHTDQIVHEGENFEMLFVPPREK